MKSRTAGAAVRCSGKSGMTGEASKKSDHLMMVMRHWKVSLMMMIFSGHPEGASY